MKLLLILYLANFIRLIHASPFDELDNDDTPGKVHALYQQHYSKYKAYLKKIGKKSDPSVPEPIRLLKFAQTMKRIDEHNERYKKGLVSYKLGLNDMSDWTEEEKKKIFGYNENRTIPPHPNLTSVIGKAPGRIPKSFNYRKKIKMVPVVNQGQCGVCFVFAALAALEIYQTLRTKQEPQRLSVQQVMDCSGMERCYGRGGSSYEVMKWVAEHGVTVDTNYPYKENDGLICPSGQPNALQALKLAGAVRLPFDDEETLRRVIALYGPVVVSLHASLQDFMDYKSGVYDNPRCPTNQANHAVLAVGYGTRDGKKYFVIRNSWGPNWGRDGYGRIAAGVFRCGIGRMSSIPIFG